MWYADALYQSRFGNILFTSHITRSIRSATAKRAWLPPSAQSARRSP